MKPPYSLSFASFASFAKTHIGKAQFQFCQFCRFPPLGGSGKARLKCSSREGDCAL